MKQIIRSVVFTLSASLAGASAVNAAQAVLLPDTFDNPVYVTGAPGESTLLFVVEQTGKIRVLDNEVAEPRPFLDLTARISGGGERGVLSMAFSPDYATNRRFYVAFTNTMGDVVVEEFKRTHNHKLADPSTHRRVITIRHRDAGNHNGGQLQFGPDGYLYISIGDGGATPEQAPNLRSLLGKILRIDPREQGSLPYRIPRDNPFVKTSNRQEIFAYGFRNPWRFSFDSNRIVIADVGEVRYEEINFLKISQAKGANFGWPQYEGNRRYDNTHPGADPVTFPMLVYPHDGRCAVIGGYISRDPTIPALMDRYLYGDLCDGVIRSMVPDVAEQEATDVRRTGIVAGNLSSFGRGPQNRLYITQTTGEVSRISP